MAQRLARITVDGVPRIVDLLAPQPLLFATNYDATPTGSSLVPPWQSEQEPTVEGVLQPTRVSLVDAAGVPGSGTYKPTGKAMRVELRPYADGDVTDGDGGDGDVTNTGGQLSNRAEVYARHAVPGTAAAEEWPDPVGSTRWYGFSLYIPPGHVFATDTTWFSLTQFKGRYGGSPPVSIEIKRSNLRLGGARANSGLIPNDGTIGVATTGAWTRIVVGMKLSPDPTVGWVELWRDGTQRVPRTALATMDYRSATTLPDPVYVKQGIYRSSAWTVTHVLWFGPLRIGRNRRTVM